MCTALGAARAGRHSTVRGRTAPQGRTGLRRSVGGEGGSSAWKGAGRARRAGARPGAARRGAPLLGGALLRGAHAPGGRRPAAGGRAGGARARALWRRPRPRPRRARVSRCAGAAALVLLRRGAHYRTIKAWRRSLAWKELVGFQQCSLCAGAVAGQRAACAGAGAAPCWRRSSGARRGAFAAGLLLPACRCRGALCAAQRLQGRCFAACQASARAPQATW